MVKRVTKLNNDLPLKCPFISCVKPQSPKDEWEELQESKPVTDDFLQPVDI